MTSSIVSTRVTLSMVLFFCGIAAYFPSSMKNFNIQTTPDGLLGASRFLCVESGRGLRHSRTLRAFSASLKFALAPWSEAVLCRGESRNSGARPGLFRLFLWAAAIATFVLLPTAMNADPALTNLVPKLQSATFGGGCFWCAEAVFQRIPGVKSVTSGFAGGTTENPSYADVCTGQTGHAEVIQIQFDPSVISYEKLLEVFWEAHDATTLNRQGPDAGTQYRSIILYTDEAQKRAAEKSKAEAAHEFSSPIVTQIVPLTKFYSAEAYHQDYYNQHTHQTYCQFVIRPKLQKLIDKGVIPNDQK